MKIPSRKSVLERVSDQTTVPDLTRVLHVAEDENAIVLFPLVDPPKKPVIAKLNKIVEEIEKGFLRITTYKVPAYMLGGAENLTEAAQKIRDSQWEMIQPLIEVGPKLFGSERGSLIKQRAAQLNKSEKAIYRALYRYWYYGMTKDALIPATANCGGKGTTRTPNPDVKRGRPSKLLKMTKDTTFIGVNVTEDDRKNFNKAIDLFYVAEGKSLKKTFQKMRERFYNEGYVEERGVLVPILKDAHVIPKLNQFQYWFHKERDELALLKARSRSSDWEMNRRAITGTAQQNVAGPCARFEIDSTIADVFLVSRYNKRYIIGRPTIYIVIDVYSRMIVGMYIGWEHPSWDSARLALTNAFSNKVDYCAEYGIEITPKDWPCHHLPQRLLADRGEIVGEAPTGMIDNLDIQVENTPPYRGDLKGVVESRFAIFNGDPIADLPAAIDTKSWTRGAPDPRLDAALDIREFTMMMIEAVIHHNNFSEKPHLLTKEMIADNVLPNPIHIWNWGLENASGSVEIFDIDAVRLHLLRQGQASIREDGIHFKGLRYTSSCAIAENWFARARNKGSWKIDVRYDNTTTNNIWYFDKDSGKLEQCELMDSEERYHNMRMEEVANLLDHISASEELRADAAARNQAKRNALNTKTNKDASSKAKAARSGMTKASQTNGTRDNRQVETALDRAVRGNSNSAPPPAANTDNARTPNVVPIKEGITAAQQRSQAKLLNQLQELEGGDDEL